MSEIQLPDWTQPLFSEDYRYFAVAGGRGSSKSWSVAAVLIIRAAQKPLRILCAREVQKSIKDSVKRLLDDTIDRMGFRSMFKSTDTEIRGKNGSLFIFMGLQHNIDSVKSTEGIDICWCEESQSLSQSSLSKLIPTIRKKGSQFYFTWNPENPKDPVDAMFAQDEKPPRTCYLKVNFDQNPWFTDELREEMEHDRKIDYGMYCHKWLGEYLTRTNANVFQNWRVEDFRAPRDAFFRFGADWGYSVDPTVLVRAYVEGRKLYVDYEAYMVGCEIDDTPALFATVPQSEKWPIIADSSSPERISHLRKHGYPKIMKAIKGARSIEEGIEFLRTHEIIVHPRCEKTIEELRNYKYRIDPQTDEITNVLEDKNNHVCVAEGELVETQDRGYVPIEDINVRDLVRTRSGFKRVLFCGITGRYQETYLIKTISGKTLRLTGCHKVLTGRGWLTVRDMRYNDTIISRIESCRNQSHRNSMVLFITDILSRTVKVRENTTGQVDQACVLPYYIGTFGNTITAQFLRACTSITLITTLTITIFQILSVSLCLSTLKSIGMMIGRLIKSSTWTRLGILQKNGMLQRKVTNGTLIMEKMLEKTSCQWKKTVSIVRKNFSQKNLGTQTNSAQTSANQHGEGLKDWMTLPGYAHVAKENLHATGIIKQNVAVDRVLTITDGSKSRAVYNLMVEDLHEYFAQDILILNCDALRYAMEAVRRTVQNTKKTPSDFMPLPSKHFWS